MNTSDHPDHGSAPVDHVAPVDHRAAVAAETARFVAVVDGADLAAPVPSCPGWTLGDLVKHTGSVQRWFSVLLRGRIQEPPRSRDVDLRLPAQDDGYVDWLAAGAAEAADAFAATDPDAPMWVWGADPHARFWARRMLFETLLHRVDAELALGLRPSIDPALAIGRHRRVPGQSALRHVLRTQGGQPARRGQTIRFRCTDGDGDWLVRLRPDGFGLDGDGAGAGTAADATVEGTAADLLLLLYGRLQRDADVFERVGDEGLLAHWFANSEF